MTGRNGFEILGRFYPTPDRFRLGDPVLVRDVTGMAWPDFIDAYERMEVEGGDDQIVIAGMVAVAFWQGNPTMSRDKVRRVLERTWQDDVELIGETDEESEEIPPELGGEKPPEHSSESNGSQDLSSETLSLSGSGSPGSTTGSPE